MRVELYKKEFTMVVTFNPQLMATRVPFGETPASAVNTNVAATTAVTTAVAEKQPEKGPKIANFASKVSYAWINTTENIKGFFKGAFMAAVTGTVIAGVDAVITGLNKAGAKKIAYKEIFTQPTKAMGAVGKIVAPLVSALVLGGYLVSARLNANKRTANVDHQLYTNHRTK